MEAFNTRRARFFKSTMFRRRFVSVFMSGAKRKAVHRQLDRRRNDLCGEVRRKGVSPLAKEKRLPPTRRLSLFLDERVSLLRHFSGWFRIVLPMKRGGGGNGAGGSRAT